MSTVSESTHVSVPARQLFTHLATLWESGAGLGGEGSGRARLSSIRVGPGFRRRCAGRRWGLPADAELEIEEFLESEGWRAVSRQDPILSWAVRIAPSELGAHLTCVLQHTPSGVAGWVRDGLVGRRRRRRALRQALHAWKAYAERQEALRRLRAVLDAPGPGPPKSPRSASEHLPNTLAQEEHHVRP